MRRRWLWLSLSLSLVAICASCGSLIYYNNEPIRAFEHLKQEIEADLPLGTPRADVERWFKNRQITHGDIVDENNRICGLITSLPQRSFLQTAEIRIALYFDDSNRLKKLHVYRFVPSL
jgi:hypothetical protein